MEKLVADVVICGAGMAGVSGAYHLAVKQGIKKVLLVDERAPLTLTSDKSTEAYRNWWPGPGDTMVRFMNRSIDLLDHLALESGNYFNMSRRGYVFLTARPDQARVMERAAKEISDLGAGPIRTYRGKPGDPAYPAVRPKGYDPGLNGAELVLDPARVRRQYPFIQDTALAMLHVRRCGWLSAQQLGMYLLQQAKEAGAQYLMGRVSGVGLGKGQVESVQVTGEKNRWEITTRCFVIAAGPLLKQAGALIGIDFPVFNELHGKIAFHDPRGVIPRDVPLMIWTDPMKLPWTEEERELLAGSERSRWLVEEFPSGVHFRPEGGEGSQAILALWTYDIKPQEPVWPTVFDPEYAEIVLRGTAGMVPGLSVYLGKTAKPFVDGGYYCKTQENRPLIGPLPVQGAFVIGALSGFGIMAGMAAGELLGNHVSGSGLPDYAPAFLLSRYGDPEYKKLLQSWDATSGQL